MSLDYFVSDLPGRSLNNRLWLPNQTAIIPPNGLRKMVRRPAKGEASSNGKPNAGKEEHLADIM
jgi:hypothetical protein